MPIVYQDTTISSLSDNRERLFFLYTKKASIIDANSDIDLLVVPPRLIDIASMQARTNYIIVRPDNNGHRQ